MNTIRRKMIIGIVACAGILCLQACMQGRSLKTESIKKADFQGTYTLILYGGNFADDIETVAILDREGDRYTFEPYAPEFKYKVVKGQTSEHALPAAEKFIRGHSSYHGQRIQAVLDDRGEVLGYEIRPLYLPLTYGTDDVLDVDYYLKDNKVIVTIRLKPSVERKKNGFKREDK